MDHILGICQEVGPGAQVVQLASHPPGDDPQNLPSVLDLDRHSGLQHLIEDVVEALLQS